MKIIKLNVSIFFLLNFIFTYSGLAFAEESSSRKVILLLGDGMGPGQLGLLKTAWDYGRKHNLVPDRESSYDKLLSQGDVSLLSVKPAGYLVADSACAASSISTANDCLPETLGLNERGEEVEIFSEFAKKYNISVGLVSDTRLTHATPAAFYGRSKNRTDERLLAEQFMQSGVDVAFSGGKKFFENIKFIDNAKALNELDSIPALGLFTESGMPDALLEKSNESITSQSVPIQSVPSLRQMSKKALELISKKDSYFLMIESGQIDWAAHSNDAGLMLREMLRFEEVLFDLLEFIKINPDVTLMVLSDHETGGFAFSYKRFASHKNPTANNQAAASFPGYQARYDFIPEQALEVLFSQKVSLYRLSEEMKALNYDFTKTKKLLSSSLGISLSKDFENALRSLSTRDFKKIYSKEFGYKKMYYLDEDSLDQAVIGKYLSDHQQVNWSTGSHTVPLIPFVVAGGLQKEEYKKPLSLVQVGKLLRDIFID